MGIKEKLYHLGGKLVFEGPARKAGATRLVAALRSAGEAIVNNAGQVADTPKNRYQLGHTIAIERWAQQRLKALLGTPLPKDDSNDYIPAKDLDLMGLRTLFQTTRQETVELAEQLAQQSGEPQIDHDQFGPWTRHGWLRYMLIHSNTEGRRWVK